MKKKGFTLIELLAVIVILAVIALIATPAVLGIIEDSKKSAAEASARNIVSAAKAYYMSNLMNNVSTGSIDLSNSNFKYDGEQATKGYLTYETKGNVTGKMYISGYCIEIKNDGSITSNKTKESDCDIESPAPSTTDLSCFNITDTTITSYKCYDGNTDGLPTITDVVIPDGIIEIGAGTFLKKNLTSVVIPNSVTTIGERSFEGNQLTSVEIPNSVITIEFWAFLNNKLTSVEIPDSVTLIDDFAFASNQLTSVTIGNSVTEIGTAAFITNKLTSIIIPNSVKTIDGSAFASNELTNVTIPNSVKTIGYDAFANNSNLKTITIDNTSGSISGSPWGADSATIKYLR